MQGVLEVRGEDGVRVNTGGVQAPDGDGIKVELRFAGGAVSIGVIAVPRAVVPEVDCVKVFQVKVLFCILEGTGKSGDGGRGAAVGEGGGEGEIG